MLSAEEFEQLVVETLDHLPPAFARHLDNVEIIIEDRPTREHRQHMGLKPWQSIYGYYEGVPLTERSTFDMDIPATIFLFRQPLTRDFPSATILREQVRRTILHEIAHHFGISDERLDELGAY